jgi:hypothetical protein
MINDNRSDFNQCAALVFRLLYESFPIETNINVDELITESFEDERIDNYFATIRFLQRENLIRYQELHYNCYNGAVLTAKGLKLLDSVLDLEDEEKTIAEQINQALEKENEKAVEAVIREFIKRV